MVTKILFVVFLFQQFVAERNICYVKYLTSNKCIFTWLFCLSKVEKNIFQKWVHIIFNWGAYPEICAIGLAPYFKELRYMGTLAIQTQFENHHFSFQSQLANLNLRQYLLRQVFDLLALSHSHSDWQCTKNIEHCYVYVLPMSQGSPFSFSHMT